MGIISRGTKAFVSGLCQKNRGKQHAALVIVAGNPGVFFPNPYPYPKGPYPQPYGFLSPRTAKTAQK